MCEGGAGTSHRRAANEALLLPASCFTYLLHRVVKQGYTSVLQAGAVAKTILSRSQMRHQCRLACAYKLCMH